MNRFNKFISALLFTVTMCFALLNNSAYAADTEKTWQEAYLEAMDEYSQDPKEYCECRLIYLDDDDIPELYIGDPMSYWYGGLYSYSDGKLIKLKDFGFKDFFSAYSEKNGIFRNDYFIERSGSIIGINFIKMENSSLTVLDKLSHDIVNDIYELNGETVDKETYDKKISEYSFTHITDNSLLSTQNNANSYINAVSDYLTYDEMKQYLLNAMEDNTDTTNPTENAAESTAVSVTINTEQETTSTETTVKTTAETNIISSTTTKTTTLKTGSPKTGDNGMAAISFAGITAIGISFIIYKRINIC